LASEQVQRVLWHYLKLHQIAKEQGKEWEFMGEKYKTQKALRERIEGDAELYEATKRSLITSEVERAYNIEHEGEK
jgi:hypothetical protein